MSIQASPSSSLIKHSVAEQIREQIICGAIAPGDRVVEAKWAALLGVAEGSIREALNLLAAQGFVRKEAGRSARVIRFTAEAVRQTYEIRAVLEGLAGRLVTERRPDISLMEAAYLSMEAAVQSGDVKALIEADLRFHLLLLELSGNPLLLEQGRRLLIPLFAFVLMRVETGHQGTDPWKSTLVLHQRILEFLRGNDPVLTELFIVRTSPKFATVAYDVWDETATDNSAPSLDEYK